MSVNLVWISDYHVKKISEGESYVDIGCQGERVEVWIRGQGLRIGVVFDVY